MALQRFGLHLLEQVLQGQLLQALEGEGPLGHRRRAEVLVRGPVRRRAASDTWASSAQCACRGRVDRHLDGLVAPAVTREAVSTSRFDLAGEGRVSTGAGPSSASRIPVPVKGCGRGRLGCGKAGRTTC